MRRTSWAAAISAEGVAERRFVDAGAGERPLARQAVLGGERAQQRHAARATDGGVDGVGRICQFMADRAMAQDRKSTRLNSSHANISYAVFCLKKKLPT